MSTHLPPSTILSNPKIRFVYNEEDYLLRCFTQILHANQQKQYIQILNDENKWNDVHLINLKDALESLQNKHTNNISSSKYLDELKHESPQLYLQLFGNNVNVNIEQFEDFLECLKEYCFNKTQFVSDFNFNKRYHQLQFECGTENQQRSRIKIHSGTYTNKTQSKQKKHNQSTASKIQKNSAITNWLAKEMINRLWPQCFPQKIVIIYINTHVWQVYRDNLLKKIGNISNIKLAQLIEWAHVCIYTSYTLHLYTIYIHIYTEKEYFGN